MEGPKIIFEIPIFGGIPVTETIVNSWIVIVFIAFLCKFLTWKMQNVPKGKQVLAEKLVLMINGLVEQTMGKDKMRFAPYIGALFVYSATCSLSSLVGLRPPTADLNTTLGWALVTFAMVQYNSIRSHGILGYLKGFLSPTPVMLPMNIVSEAVNPISMSFRHFGNIAAGTVITSLLYGALAAASTVILGWIPNTFISTIPILQLGLPALLSIYFDLFSSCLQAFIFCMLTMVFVANAID